MRWSKLKQRIEGLFAEAVEGRVEIWATRYHGSRDQDGEAWVTLDKKPVLRMCTLTQLKERRRRLDSPDSELSWDEVSRDLEGVGIMQESQFMGAMFDYLNLSIDEILASDRMIIRAFGMLDRRLGKRRLKALDVTNEKPIVRDFYDMRCSLEGGLSI